MGKSVLQRLIWSGVKELLAVAFQIAVYLGVISGLIALVVKLEPLTHDMAMAATPAKPQWVVAERSPPAFAMSVPDIADPHPGYSVLRDADGGGRRDVMTFAGRGRSATIEVYRPGDELTKFGTFESDLAARIKPLGVAERIVQAPAIDTRFGQVELYDFTLTTESRQHGCLGFVRNQSDPKIQIVGWACQAGPEMVLRPMVACALDRLTLLSAGNDANLARFFAHAEVKGTFCGGKQPHGPHMAAAAPWMEANRAPKLRRQSLRQ
jgi:hypothetical protein